jgi:hypothetical protein
MHAFSSHTLIVLVSAGLLFASGPAGARGGGGHSMSASHATRVTQTVTPSFAESSGKGTEHHPGKPSSGGNIAASRSSNNAAALIEQSMPTATPPVSADMTRNPALTGGTDPAIGQSSPPVPEVFASGGGTAAVDHSGGSGKTLADCMQLWDAHTHMSKPEWRVTCGRTLNGIDLPADGGMTVPTSTRAHARHTRTRAQAQ